MSLEVFRRSVEIDGVRLSYIERGPGNNAAGPPLLLLHGLIATAETLLFSLGGLVDDRRIVALDLLSAAGEQCGDMVDLSFSSLGKLIVKFASEIGLVRPVLLGHSHGGALALHVAVMRPEFSCGLILLCPAHPFGGYSDALVRFYLTPPGNVFARMLPYIPARWLNVSRLAGPNSVVPKAQVERYRQALRLHATVPRILRLLKSWEIDMSWLGKRLRNTPIAAPVLLLWGDCDPAVPVGSAPALERFLPASERITLRGIGHLPADEAPAMCTDAIGLWLARCDFLCGSTTG